MHPSGKELVENIYEEYREKPLKGKLWKATGQIFFRESKLKRQPDSCVTIGASWYGAL